MLDELNTESKNIGLKINRNKTKIMHNRFANPIGFKLEEEILENVENFSYLGHIIDPNGNRNAEIKKRTQLSWAAFGKLNNIFKNKDIPLNFKRKTFDQCILPVLTYGSETWTLTKKMTTKIITTQRKMERIIMGITLRDKKKNSWIRQQTKVIDTLQPGHRIFSTSLQRRLKTPKIVCKQG